jgi:hypothetical protein
MLADCCREGQAIHLRHLQVQNRQLEDLTLSYQIERIGRGGDGIGQHPPRLGLQRKDPPVGGIVIRYEQSLAGQLLRCAAQVWLELARSRLPHDGNEGCAPFTWLSSHPSPISSGGLLIARPSPVPP